MKTIQYTMKPQDLLILLKIIAAGNQPLGQVALAEALNMSQSEISQSLVRSKFSGLLDGSGKKVMGMGLLDFLQHGLAYVFPQKPGAIVRGIPTAHSAPPLDKEFQSDEVDVWPSASGQVRGQSIQPLYPSVVKKEKKELSKEELELRRARRRALAASDSGKTSEGPKEKAKEPEKKAKPASSVGLNIFSTFNADSLKKYQEKLKKDSVK